MVIRFALLALFCGLVLPSCSTEEQVAEVSESATAQSSVESTTRTVEAEEPDEISIEEPVVDTIRLLYVPGEVYRYHVKQVSTSIQDTVNAKTTSYHTYTKRVKDIQSNGNFDVDMAFNSIKLDVEVRNATTGVISMQNSFDSEDAEQVNDPVNSQFAHIIDEDVTITFTPNAQVVDIVGVAPIVKSIIATTPDASQIPPAQLQQMSKQLEQQIQSVMFGAFASQEFIPYPKTSVPTDGKWVNTSTSPIGAMFTVTSNTTYTIQSVKVVKGQRIATIKAVLRGEIVPNPVPAGAGVSLSVVDAKISGTSTAVMNLANGTTVSKSNRIIVSVTADLTDTASGEKRRMNQSQESFIEVKLLP